MIKEAMLYHTLDEGKVACELCSHRCTVAPSKFGFCGVRQNTEGKLYSHVYGEVIAAHVDPIEKKPLYHYLPGTSAFSVATIGCNFRCPFCQNWQISQKSKRRNKGNVAQSFSPEEVVKAACNHKCRSISYTYTEPTVYFEFAHDTAKLAKKEGLGNSFVTNGYMTPEALETIHPFLDACNVDLKSFDEKFYREMCQAHLQPVLDSIKVMKKLGIWIEITTLIIPDQNDSDAELTRIARFIAKVDPNIPWHISRFHPDYDYRQADATPIRTLRRAFTIGKREGLSFVYIGNVPGESEDTICSNCRKTLIKRTGFFVGKNQIVDGLCPFCGHPVAGVF